MRTTTITVPDMNDSFSRLTLDMEVYLIRFTWNDTAERWSFGLYTRQREPIAVGIKIVPSFPLNLQIVDSRFPLGVFGVISRNGIIGRDDFKNGLASFVFKRD